MEEWKALFKEIHGKSPTSTDFEIAPDHIKSLIKTENPKIEEKTEKRGTKRKHFEMKMCDGEQFSPIKKRTNNKKQGILSNLSPVRKSPRKRLTVNFSPVKSPMKTSFLSPKKKLAFFDTSPSKSALSPAKENFTPKIGKRVDFDDVSPMKAISTKSSGTPIKSPQKRTYKPQLGKDLDLLLLPTPEKVEPEYEDFDDETTEDVAKSRANHQRSLFSAKKSSDQNFQKINLRKKTFVRGKVTAEQKRKMKRKQMYRKRGGV